MAAQRRWGIAFLVLIVAIAILVVLSGPSHDESADLAPIPQADDIPPTRPQDAQRVPIKPEGQSTEDQSNEGRFLHVSVVDFGERPIAKARVVRTGGPPDFQTSTSYEADGQGIVEIPLADDDVVPWLLVTRAGYSGRIWSPSQDSRGSERKSSPSITVRLHALTPFSVIVTDASGRPVEGANVKTKGAWAAEAHSFFPDEGALLTALAPEEYTGSDGQCTMQLDPSAKYRLRVDHFGYVPYVGSIMEPHAGYQSVTLKRILAAGVLIDHQRRHLGRLPAGGYSASLRWSSGDGLTTREFRRAYRPTQLTALPRQYLESVLGPSNPIRWYALEELAPRAVLPTALLGIFVGPGLPPEKAKLIFRPVNEIRESDLLKVRIPDQELIPVTIVFNGYEPIESWGLRRESTEFQCWYQPEPKTSKPDPSEDHVVLVPPGHYTIMSRAPMSAWIPGTPPEFSPREIFVRESEPMSVEVQCSRTSGSYLFLNVEDGKGLPIVDYTIRARRSPRGGTNPNAPWNEQDSTQNQWEEWLFPSGKIAIELESFGHGSFRKDLDLKPGEQRSLSVVLSDTN